MAVWAENMLLFFPNKKCVAYKCQSSDGAALAPAHLDKANKMGQRKGGVVMLLWLLQLIIFIEGGEAEDCSTSCWQSESNAMKGFQKISSQYSRKCDHNMKLEVKIQKNQCEFN